MREDEAKSIYFKGKKGVNNSFLNGSADDNLRYIESHIIRANIARIMGLIEILRLTTKDEQTDIISKLDVEVKDLELLLEELKTTLPQLIKN